MSIRPEAPTPFACARLSALAALSLCAAQAPAQMISPMLYNGPAISLQSHANATGAGGAKADPGAARAPAAGASPGGGALTFRPDPGRRRANLAAFVAKTRAVDPKGADTLAALFAQGDIIERAKPELAAHGLDADNVADAYAAYWMSAFQATRGDASTPDRQTIDAVKAQAARAIGATPQFASAGDAQKQEMAEALWLQTMILDGAVQAAQGKPDQAGAVRQAALKGAQGMGIDLTKMTLTQRGFVPARGG